MKVIKKILSPVLLGLIATIPIITIVSCGSEEFYNVKPKNDSKWAWTYSINKPFIENKKEHQNVYTSNDNETDMLTSLGFYPDYANQWSNRTDDSKNIIPTTLETRLRKLVTDGKIKKGPLYDIPNIDTEELINKNISTILIDKSDEPDENKFSGISKALIYQNSFKGKIGTFTDEFFPYSDNAQNPTNTFGLNVFGGFEGVANALDVAYKRNDLLKKAKEINIKVKSNLAKLRTALYSQTNKSTDATQEVSNGKSLIVLQASTNEAGEIIFDRMATTMVYNILYSKKPGRGLGFEFPNDIPMNNLKANPWKITATSNATLESTVKGKADYYIISFDKTDPNFSQATGSSNTTILDDFKSKLVDTNSNSNAKIHIVNRDLWKRAAWGIYGTNKLITETFISQFSSLGIQKKDLSFTSEEDIFTPSKDLKKLR